MLLGGASRSGSSSIILTRSGMDLEDKAFIFFASSIRQGRGWVGSRERHPEERRKERESHPV